MASNRDNTIFDRTSFLQGSNSPFIEDLYLPYYIENLEDLFKSMTNAFNNLEKLNSFSYY